MAAIRTKGSSSLEYELLIQWGEGFRDWCLGFGFCEILDPNDQNAVLNLLRVWRVGSVLWFNVCRGESYRVQGCFTLLQLRAFLQEKAGEPCKNFSFPLIDQSRLFSQTLAAMRRIYSIGLVLEVELFRERHKEVMFGYGDAGPVACFRSPRKEVMPFLGVVRGIEEMPWSQFG